MKLTNGFYQSNEFDATNGFCETKGFEQQLHQVLILLLPPHISLRFSVL